MQQKATNRRTAPSESLIKQHDYALLRELATNKMRRLICAALAEHKYNVNDKCSGVLTHRHFYVQGISITMLSGGYFLQHIVNSQEQNLKKGVPPATALEVLLSFDGIDILTPGP